MNHTGGISCRPGSWDGRMSDGIVAITLYQCCRAGHHHPHQNSANTAPRYLLFGALFKRRHLSVTTAFQATWCCLCLFRAFLFACTYDDHARTAALAQDAAKAAYACPSLPQILLLRRSPSRLHTSANSMCLVVLSATGFIPTTTQLAAFSSALQCFRQYTRCLLFFHV